MILDPLPKNQHSHQKGSVGGPAVALNSQDNVSHGGTREEIGSGLHVRNSNLITGGEQVIGGTSSSAHG